MNNERRSDIGAKLSISILVAVITAFISVFIVAAVTKADKAIERSASAVAMADKNELRIANVQSMVAEIKVDVKEIKKAVLR